MSLDEFIRKAQSEHSQREFDPKLRLEKWLYELNELFNAIEAALIRAGLESKNILNVRKEMHEEFVGSYSFRRLSVFVGEVPIVFDPVATIVFGGFGRVDVRCGAGRTRLIAIDKDEDPDTKIPLDQRDWKWVVSDPAHPMDYQDFSIDKLEYILDFVVKENGRP
ncbi:conserved protein of unknown function [Pararobbsia alpina]|uniref:hypothetical protein n=1 Tax=Pararobbsia alpina TaxID=621374 RepID=UPI0039A48045